MRRFVVVAVLLFALGAGAEVAWSYITAPGTGAGTATTPSLSPITIDIATATPLNPLLPGASGDAVVELTNSNASAVTLTTVVASGTMSVSNAPGCDDANSGVTFANQSGLSVLVPAHVSDFAVDLPNAVSMADSSVTACQGATFSIPVAVTVQLG
jgi:hypothetical protein